MPPCGRDTSKRVGSPSPPYSLKTASGTGGTTRDGLIEIQGDHCELVITQLKAEGFNVKRAGG